MHLITYILLAVLFFVACFVASIAMMLNALRPDNIDPLYQQLDTDKDRER
jgi:multisubunit Na+/H+ antiporter MnhE subunit